MVIKRSLTSSKGEIDRLQLVILFTMILDVAQLKLCSTFGRPGVPRSVLPPQLLYLFLGHTIRPFASASPRGKFRNNNGTSGHGPGYSQDPL